jgi:hypothetical protein
MCVRVTDGVLACAAAVCRVAPPTEVRSPLRRALLASRADTPDSPSAMVELVTMSVSTPTPSASDELRARSQSQGHETPLEREI